DLLLEHGLPFGFVARLKTTIPIREAARNLPSHSRRGEYRRPQVRENPYFPVIAFWHSICFMESGTAWCRAGNRKRGPMRSKRVLVLDDDRAQAPGLKEWFKRFQHGYDYEVISAATASETMKALSAGRPDLVIVEPETAGFDCLDIVSKLRRHDEKIPII